MIRENRTVSRKTPRDGKLEISPSAASVVAGFGSEFDLEADGRPARARLVGMPCTCSKATALGAHVHYFLESEPLKGLPPDAVVRVEIERATKRVRVGLEDSEIVNEELVRGPGSGIRDQRSGGRDAGTPPEPGRSR